MKIAISIPTSDKVMPECLTSAQTQNFSDFYVIVNSISPQGNYKGQADVSYNSTKNRNEIRQKVLQSNASHFLFLDSDVVLPKDALLEFAKQKQFEILGGWYPMIHSPYWVAARQAAPSEYVLFSNPTPSVTKADMIGLGCLFISRKALESLAFEDGTGTFGKVMGQKCILGPCAQFGQTAMKKGFQLYMNGSVICQHLPRQV